ncbi:MAG: hypothetical protein AAGG08_10630, partial [Actinomycetota bacterium]
SLREVAVAAGQRNHSATQYHFGDRGGLVAAVFEHRMQVVNDRRHRRLDELSERGESTDLEQLVDAVVIPLVEVVDEPDGWYARFLVRTRWDAFAQTVLTDVPALASFRRAIDLIADKLPGPAEHRLHRIDQMNTLFLGTIAGWEWQRHRGGSVPPADELCADLTATCTAVLTARARVPDPTGGVA